MRVACAIGVVRTESETRTGWSRRCCNQRQHSKASTCTARSGRWQRLTRITSRKPRRFSTETSGLEACALRHSFASTALHFEQDATKSCIARCSIWLTNECLVNNSLGSWKRSANIRNLDFARVLPSAPLEQRSQRPHDVPLTCLGSEPQGVGNRPLFTLCQGRAHLLR
jgi:hypothetical protein